MGLSSSKVTHLLEAFPGPTSRVTPEAPHCSGAVYPIRPYLPFPVNSRGPKYQIFDSQVADNNTDTRNENPTQAQTLPSSNPTNPKTQNANAGDFTQSANTDGTKNQGQYLPEITTPLKCRR